MRTFQNVLIDNLPVNMHDRFLHALIVSNVISTKASLRPKEMPCLRIFAKLIHKNAARRWVLHLISIKPGIMDDDNFLESKSTWKNLKFSTMLSSFCHPHQIIDRIFIVFYKVHQLHTIPDFIHDEGSNLHMFGFIPILMLRNSLKETVPYMSIYNESMSNKLGMNDHYK